MTQLMPHERSYADLEMALRNAGIGDDDPLGAVVREHLKIIHATGQRFAEMSCVIQSRIAETTELLHKVEATVEQLSTHNALNSETILGGIRTALSKIYMILLTIDGNTAPSARIISTTTYKS